MAEFDYDLFVIGGGSGGVRAARIAAQHGARVAIAEEYRYGGTCVIRGCVPKKLFVYASRFPDAFEASEGFGWSRPEATFDWATLISNKDREIARLEAAYQRNLAAAGVETFASRAVLSGKNAVRLEAEDREFTAKYILIATGGRPNVDDSLPGVEHAITSDQAFHLERLPERIVVAGGGYIAVEFAAIFAGLGVQTTLIYRRDKVLRGFDEDLRDCVTRGLQQRGVEIVTDNVFTKIEKTEEGLAGHISDGRVLKAGEIMFAIGRSPYTAGLGLETVGVELGRKGEIVVDGASKTSVDNIYAVGDVTERVTLTPVAIREGHAFADSAFGSQQRTVDYDCIPTAVFATPELGTCGLPEHEAVERYPNLDVYTADFRPMMATLAGTEDRMFMKLLVDRDTDRVVGCHVAGDDAGEIIQMAGIAMKMGAKKSDFDATVALHPSAAEELVTMRTPTRQHGAV